MKRKTFDGLGKVVEVEEPHSPVVGNIEAKHETPPKVTLTVPPATSLGPFGELLAQLTALHIIAARWIRRRVLLIDIDQHEANQMRGAMTTIANQHFGMSNMISEVRLRLRHHERTIPLLEQSRRRFEADAMIRAKRAEKRANEKIAELGEHPAPAEAVVDQGEDDGP